MNAPLLAAGGIVKRFDLRKGLFERFARSEGRMVQALNGVSLSIERGETLGLIGESGCGKSTLARVLLRLQEPTEGSIAFDGVDVVALPHRELQALRRRMQIIFQDPYASLNPRKTVEHIVGLPLRIQEGLSREAARPRVLAMLRRVGLAPEHAERFPHQFSGGQRQRIGIARALVLHPEFVVCDEAVSALDASVQAQVIGLLKELQQELRLTYLFISHNLAVVGYVSDRIAVMYLGEIVEIGGTRELLAAPRHPYTRMLLAALPRLHGAAAVHAGAGDPPSPLRPPSGCRFHPRCPRAEAVCRSEAPALRSGRGGYAVACHFAEPPA